MRNSFCIGTSGYKILRLNVSNRCCWSVIDEETGELKNPSVQYNQIGNYLFDCLADFTKISVDELKNIAISTLQSTKSELLQFIKD
jgi:hypothetical protein